MIGLIREMMDSAARLVMFFGRSGKVLYGAFSIVGMAYQSQNVNNGIPDGRVARSTVNISLYLKDVIKYITFRMFPPALASYQRVIIL